MDCNREESIYQSHVFNKSLNVANTTVLFDCLEHDPLQLRELGLVRFSAILLPAGLSRGAFSVSHAVIVAVVTTLVIVGMSIVTCITVGISFACRIAVSSVLTGVRILNGY